MAWCYSYWIGICTWQFKFLADYLNWLKLRLWFQFFNLLLNPYICISFLYVCVTSWKSKFFEGMLLKKSWMSTTVNKIVFHILHSGSASSDWLKSHVQNPNLVPHIHYKAKFTFLGGGAQWLFSKLWPMKPMRYTIYNVTKCVLSLCHLADTKTRGALRTTLDCTL